MAIEIPFNDRRIQYLALGGETSFDYDFPIFVSSDLVVDRADDADAVPVTLVEGVDYTVTGVGLEDGGTIELTVAAIAGQIWTLFGDTPEQRLTNFQQKGDFRAEAINDELDNLTIMAQQLRRDIDELSVRAPITDPEGVNLLLEAANVRASRFFSFNADGSVGTQPGTAQPQALGDLTDVTLTGETAGDIIAFDGSIWINQRVLTANIDDNAVSGAKIAMGADVHGDVLFYNGTDYVRLPPGTAGFVLQTQGAGADPSWKAVSAITEGTPAILDPWAFNTTLLQAHGLGAVPKAFQAIMENKIAEGGWSPGDRVDLSTSLYWQNTATSFGYSAAVDNGDAVNFRITTPPAMRWMNKTTGADFAVTPANWLLEVTPRLF